MIIRNIFTKLRTKFIVAIISVVAVFGLLNIYFNKQSTYRALLNELEERCMFLARSFAQQCARLLLYEDLISVQHLIDQAKESHEDVAYCFVLDNQNHVLAHSFESGFPTEILDVNKLQVGQTSHIQLFSDENNKHYRDVNVPIMEGKLGFFRLGMEEKGIVQATNRVVFVLTAMVLGFLFIGIAGAIIFAHWITNPISKITRAFEKMDLNQEFEPLKIKTGDEINILADKFNEMTSRLQRTHLELTRAQNGLIQSEKLAAVGTLASGLAHEISSPLAGLKNCFIRIKENPGIDVINRYFNMIMTAVKKIENVVSGLLDFTRQDDFHYASFSLNEAIKNALSLMSFRLERANISVDLRLDNNVKLCQGDSHHIEQVIVNLIINALDAMPKGGKLHIASAFRDSTACLQLEDTGIGISPENINKIFNPFFSTKEPGKGTGLGLAVSYNIIEKHRGHISVKSEVDRGTLFEVYLPLISVKKG
jgi:signal transduction histidine kinase